MIQRKGRPLETYHAASLAFISRSIINCPIDKISIRLLFLSFVVIAFYDQ